MLSKQTIRELREELGRLRGRVSAIEAILDEHQPDLQSKRSDIGNGSFAATIRAVLREIGRTASSREVTRRLEQQGISARGKTPLGVTVSGELHRMAKKRTGGVVRVGHGKYKIVEES